MAKSKQERRLRIKRGIRRKISGTAERPRLTVYRSNRHIYAQLIDDVAGNTLVSASSLDGSLTGKNPVAIGKAVGLRLAERAKENGIKVALVDRNGFRFHGRMKAVADGAREGGLKI
ncbi:MAG: 50S ribosomal protein L18 [Bacteroidetes bacterium]|nr:50S ribosomal protein L18 [Bacteroidota bacterium]MCH8246324.1 50S ribosomal protein L18 [Bacteroidota bacterium]